MEHRSPHRYQNCNLRVPINTYNTYMITIVKPIPYLYTTAKERNCLYHNKLLSCKNQNEKNMPHSYRVLLRISCLASFCRTSISIMTASRYLYVDRTTLIATASFFSLSEHSNTWPNVPVTMSTSGMPQSNNLGEIYNPSQTLRTFTKKRTKTNIKFQTQEKVSNIKLDWTAVRDRLQRVTCLCKQGSRKKVCPNSWRLMIPLTKHCSDANHEWQSSQHKQEQTNHDSGTIMYEDGLTASSQIDGSINVMAILIIRSPSRRAIAMTSPVKHAWICKSRNPAISEFLATAYRWK